MQHMRNVGLNLLAHNENHAYVMPHVTVMSCTLHVVHACRQAGCPYVNVVHQKLLMDMPFTPAKQSLSKLTALNFFWHTGVTAIF